MRNVESRTPLAADLPPPPPYLPSIEPPPAPTVVAAAPPAPRKGPRCTVCDHPEVARIEMQRAAGVPLDALAAKYGLGRSAIDRHWHNHVTDKARATYLLGPTELEKLHARAAEEGESVLDYFRITRNALMASMVDARELGDPRAVATVATALTGCLKELGKITGEVMQLAGGNTTTINMQIINSPEFVAMQQAQIAALAPFPEALAAVVATWRALDATPALPMRTVKELA